MPLEPLPFSLKTSSFPFVRRTMCVLGGHAFREWGTTHPGAGLQRACEYCGFRQRGLEYERALRWLNVDKL